MLTIYKIYFFWIIFLKEIQILEICKKTLTTSNYRILRT